MKRKRIISILSLLLGCLLLFACAKTGEPQTEAAESADPNASAETPETGFAIGEPPEGTSGAPAPGR